MASTDATFLERMARVVGAAHVLTTASELAPYTVDWRGRYHGSACAVVRPATTAEVAAVVTLCADARVPIVPQGGNTGMCGAATPDESGREVVLSLGRLRSIRAVDQANATITVEAGVTLAEVQQAAANAELLFPLSLASEGSCTIGGNLSTNAGGTAVLRYGNTRDLVLGVEVVLADGRVLDALRGLRRTTPATISSNCSSAARHARHRNRRRAEAVCVAADARDRARGDPDGGESRRVPACDEASARRSCRRVRAHQRTCAAPVAQAPPDPARPASGPRLVRAAASR
jgi:hypothetical protein